MECRIGVIGFGEAGYAFATAGGWTSSAHVFDLKTDDAGERSIMLARYADARVCGRESLRAAVEGSELILSLVTADQALAVAAAAADCMTPGAVFCDMNSVAPQTKQAASSIIEAAGGHYVDVALMAPVNRGRLAVPLLLSGSEAENAENRLDRLGFTNCRTVGVPVGCASSIKMIRSVMVKGIEALTAECVMAAASAGVLDEVLFSLDESESAQPWHSRANYNLGRMMVHGLRRAAEMQEVAKTLDGLGTGSVMTRGTIERQRAIGTLCLREPASSLADKLLQIKETKAQAV